MADGVVRGWKMFPPYLGPVNMPEYWPRLRREAEAGQVNLAKGFGDCVILPSRLRNEDGSLLPPHFGRVSQRDARGIDRHEPIDRLIRKMFQDDGLNFVRPGRP